MKNSRLDHKTLGILAWPAYATKSSNPYNYLIYKNIEETGHLVYEFDFNIKNFARYLFSSKYDILHIHWPTNILTYSTFLQASRRLLMFKCFIKTIKLLGKKIVWTVHNLESHESEHPKLQQKLNNFLYKNTDGFISLNASGLNTIKRSTTLTKKQKFVYISHPLYTNYYPNHFNKAESRAKLAIAENKQVFLFLGQIRRYKNILGLIKAFKELELANKFLLIAGNVHKELDDELTAAVANQDNILLKNSFITDNDLHLYLNSADLVVTPYSKIFNSGSVFLNLSFNRPTLAPKTDTFIELRKQFGDGYIRLYEGELQAKDLVENLQSAINLGRLNADLINNFSPKSIAEKTISFYLSLFD